MEQSGTAYTSSVVPGALETTAQILTNASSGVFLSSTLYHLKATASNATFLNPSPMDLLMVVPRMIVRAGSFVLNTVPEQIDNVFRLGNRGSIIAGATGEGTSNIAPLASVGYAEGVAAATGAMTERVQETSLRNAFSFQHVRSFGGIFTYMTSKWALGCFTVVSKSQMPGYDKCASLDRIANIL